MAATLGCEFRELTEKIENAEDPENLRIYQRHQKVLEARAKLQAEAGSHFLKVFSRFKDQVDKFSKITLSEDGVLKNSRPHVSTQFS